MATSEPVPRTYHLSCEVDPYRGGWTLERFLTHRFRYHSPDMWNQRIAEGLTNLSERETSVNQTIDFELVNRAAGNLGTQFDVTTGSMAQFDFQINSVTQGLEDLQTTINQLRFSSLSEGGGRFERLKENNR